MSALRRHWRRMPRLTRMRGSVGASRCMGSEAGVRGTERGSGQGGTDVGRTRDGMGFIRATVSGYSGKTELTEVSHRSPTRVVPMPSSRVVRAGAAVCSLSSYGGGFVHGDQSALVVQVDEGARLAVATQGATRVYGEPTTSLRAEVRPSSQTLYARVERDAFLVSIPDPVVPFATADFLQSQTFALDPTASLVAVDWFSSGRFLNGERGDFKFLSSRTQVEVGTQLLVDDAFALHLDDPAHMALRLRDHGSAPFEIGDCTSVDSFATVFMFGAQTCDVAREFLTLSRELLGEHTRVRSPSRNESYDTKKELHRPVLSDRVMLSCSDVQLSGAAAKSLPLENACVARIAASSSDDIYRVLHWCLKPLESTFGTRFYGDRVHASAPAPVQSMTPRRRGGGDEAQQSVREHAFKSPPADEGALSDTPLWATMMLSDSGLPIGGFAHSSGIETAHQLQLLGSDSEEQLHRFICAAAGSSVQLHYEHIVAGAHLGPPSISADTSVDDILAAWKAIDLSSHATLASNPPAVRASLEQGAGLVRVAQKWLESSRGGGASPSPSHALFARIGTEVRKDRTQGHMAPLFGLFTACLGVQEDVSCEIFGYCVARDMVSAAVRLNLLGPIASIPMLSDAEGAIRRGIRAAKRDIEFGCGASTSAPHLDAVQPQHEQLAMRLFRS